MGRPLAWSDLAASEQDAAVEGGSGTGDRNRGRGHRWFPIVRPIPRKSTTHGPAIGDRVIHEDVVGEARVIVSQARDPVEQGAIIAADDRQQIETDRDRRACGGRGRTWKIGEHPPRVRVGSGIEGECLGEVGRNPLEPAFTVGFEGDTGEEEHLALVRGGDRENASTGRNRGSGAPGGILGR